MLITVHTHTHTVTLLGLPFAPLIGLQSPLRCLVLKFGNLNVTMLRTSYTSTMLNALCDVEVIER